MRHRHLASLLLLLLAAPLLPAQTTDTQVPDASQFVGPPAGVPLTGEVLNKRATEVSALLRCPVCQGLSVADSPAEMAVNMKGQVRDLLARGYTEEQILRYFEQSYGQFVLLRPKFEGLNTLVWLLPLVALLIGAAVVFMKLKKLERGGPAAPAPPADAAEDPYLSQVRQLVGGGKK
ncbi:MAG TPA: cytochrome c-type biogenesis protein [Thermoanaerobaculia bacterium]|nr:cytochrome c-type biogenesis protein [Thermoanaerobaculia bacterium]